MHYAHPNIMWKQISAMFVVGALGCATTSTTERTWGAPGMQGEVERTGTVESVHEIVQRVEGNPGAGALLGAVIGGVLTRGRPIGVVGGAAVGAASSQGSAERRIYELAVRFDDGVYGSFRYAGYSPFPPGARVALTPDGLEPL
jgi:outer membrane lipoprotein SlyB